MASTIRVSLPLELADELVAEGAAFRPANRSARGPVLDTALAVVGHTADLLALYQVPCIARDLANRLWSFGRRSPEASVLLDIRGQTGQVRVDLSEILDPNQLVTLIEAAFELTATE